MNFESRQQIQDLVERQEMADILGFKCTGTFGVVLGSCVK